ncbi:MAG: histone H1-like repetitive region-containing protein [Acidimicrobiales bacterium]
MADKEKDIFQRYLDAGIAFTNLTRARAEELVEELIQGGELQGADAKARVEDLLERSRRGRAAFVEQVRREVDHQLDALGVTSLEDLAHQVAEVLSRTAETGRKAAKKRTGKKTGGKKALAKKALAKKSTAKKAAAKKSTAKKAAAKKSTAKKAGTKKAGAKKATAKKVAPRTSSSPMTRKNVSSSRAPDRGTA